jgi:hypothetical protein
MSADEENRKQFELIQQDLVKAWITHDRSILERLLAPEWIVTHTDGRISSREDVLRDFDTGANRILEGRVDEVKVQMLNGVAVVHGRTHARGEYKEHSYDVVLRFTDVFVRRNEQWQAVASHASRIANSDSAAGGLDPNM